MEQSPASSSSLYQQANVVYVGAHQQLPVQLSNNLILPYPLVERMIEERHNHLSATQRNNHLVAVSVLKTSVVSFLQFERSFKTLLSKGDDSTQIAIIKYSIAELRAANQSYDSLMDKNDPVRFLVTEPSYIVDIRELFEHCIKILALMLHLLGGRDIKTNAHEYLSQNYTSWAGWQQQGEQISLSNNVLNTLIKHLLPSVESKDDHLAHIINEVRLFSDSVLHVTDSFLARKYPTKSHILEIYKKNEKDMLRYMTVHDTNHVEIKEGKGSTKLVSTGWF